MFVLVRNVTCKQIIKLETHWCVVVAASSMMKPTRELEREEAEAPRTRSKRKEDNDDDTEEN